MIFGVLFVKMATNFCVPRTNSILQPGYLICLFVISATSLDLVELLLQRRDKMSGEGGEFIVTNGSPEVDKGVAEIRPSNLKMQRYSLSRAPKFTLSFGHSKCEIKYVFLNLRFTQLMKICYQTVKGVYFVFIHFYKCPYYHRLKFEVYLLKCSGIKKVLCVSTKKDIKFMSPFFVSVLPRGL